MRHSALKRCPTHHNTNRLPHPGQAARSERKRELQRVRRDYAVQEAVRLGIPVLEYEHRRWCEIAAFCNRTSQQCLEALYRQFPLRYLPLRDFMSHY